MGKHGPCCHCGVTSTPLWRNGPPEKPVLCNACGSRWRTKGTLANYTPLHARAEPDDFVDYRAPKGKTISIKNKEANFLKRKFDNRVTDYGMVAPQYNEGHRKPFHEDISNRSSSGSAISNSESCAQYGTAEASDLTGPAQPVVWDSTVPSRKRTCVTRSKPSPVDLLTEDLYTIWNEQSSCLSVEDDLLPVTNEPMGSVEFGHGSVLIRQPSSMAREEESEASSFPVDHKQHTVSSQRMLFPGLKEETGVNSSIRGIKKPASQGVVTDRTRREEGQLEKFQTLAHHNSPLCLIDLQDIVNFDQFANLLTNDEQQSLLKLLSPADTAEPSLEASKANQGVLCFSRLKSMFDSPQLKENMLSFQKVLADGVFDGSLSGFTKDDCKMLKKLLLGTAEKSKWVEQYKIFEESKGKTGVHESEVVGVFNNIPTNYSATKKRSQDGQPQKLAGAKVGMKNPKRILVKSNYEQKELIDDDENFLSAKRALSSHTNNGSLVLDSSHFMEDSSEQDLLIDLPCHSSFPQAELLLPITSFGAQASTSSSSVYPNAMRR